MKRLFTHLILSCFLVLSTGFTLFAQQVDVKGKVFNSKSEPLANVSVYLLTAKAEAVIKPLFQMNRVHMLLKTRPKVNLLCRHLR